MRLLHANFLNESETERQQFAHLFLDAATRIPGPELDRWLCSTWRESLTAAWIIGLTRAREYHDGIREKLLASSTFFAGQGFCFAMARFETPAAAEALCEYLDHYLPVEDREYDQEWAIGALAWLDGRLGSQRAGVFVEDSQLWSVTFGGRRIGSLNPSRGIDKMREVMEFAEDIGFNGWWA